MLEMMMIEVMFEEKINATEAKLLDSVKDKTAEEGFLQIAKEQVGTHKEMGVEMTVEEIVELAHSDGEPNWEKELKGMVHSYAMFLVLKAEGALIAK